ncbi:hypothetical protein ABFY50_00295 [Bacillus amyloliquefaciens]
MSKQNRSADKNRSCILFSRLYRHAIINAGHINQKKESTSAAGRRAGVWKAGGRM